MTRRVLIVEDQADIRRLLRLTLELEDCEIHEAADGEQGWQMAQALLPDIVLLDRMMPRMDGLALCRLLRAHPVLATRPVVMLTARGAAADREAGQQAGVTHYLVKPFSPMELLRLVDTLWQSE
jgi:two-component system, OmpR family, phosphate regulon response regulator PhoB